jgi:small subunit ribosomal protein S17
MTEQDQRGSRKKREGVVVRKSTDKTLIVNVTRSMQHSQFRKIVKVQKKYYVHDAANKAKVGDKVIIIESKPISKLKHWRLLEVLPS